MGVDSDVCVTGEQMQALAEAGQFWWMRPGDGSFYATDEQTPLAPEDVYLLNATPEWCAQWSSWDEAAEVMTPMFARLNDFRT